MKTSVPVQSSTHNELALIGGSREKQSAQDSFYPLQPYLDNDQPSPVARFIVLIPTNGLPEDLIIDPFGAGLDNHLIV